MIQENLAHLVVNSSNNYAEPKLVISNYPLSYVMADKFLPLLLISKYNHKFKGIDADWNSLKLMRYSTSHDSVG